MHNLGLLNILDSFLTVKQKQNLYEWMMEVTKKTPEIPTAIGGAFTAHLTPTTLGTVIKVEYSRNKETIDLTEYDMW